MSNRWKSTLSQFKEDSRAQPLRLVNRCAGLLERGGVSLVALNEADIFEAAKKRTGSTCPTDPQFLEGFHELLHSAQQAKLNLFGRSLLFHRLVQVLTNRTRLMQVRKESDLDRVSLNQPLVVVGLPRSGTTHLHRLLAQAPDAEAIPFWELLYPIPFEGPDRRRVIVGRQFKLGKWLTPGLDVKHAVRIDSPEECAPLFDGSMVSFTYWMGWPVYSYLEWYLKQDKHEAYRHYRSYLQYFQRQRPGKRLVLKAPAHTPALAALREIIPEAQVVQIHRDPVQVVPSVNSLTQSIHSAASDGIDMQEMVRMNLAFLDACLAGCPTEDSTSVLHVSYGELVAHPERVVQAVHRHFGLPEDEGLLRRIAQYQRSHPKHKHGAHRYRVEDFGLEEAGLAQRFGEYRRGFERFLVA